MTSKEALQVMLEFTAPQGEKQHLECSEAYLKLNRDLEILEIFKNNDYYVVEDEGLYRITFSLHDYDLDDFTYWKNENRKKTLF